MIKKLLMLAVAYSTTGLSHATTITQFSATLTSDGVIASGVVGTGSPGMGTATFVLREPDIGSPTLSYHIMLAAADLDGSQTGALDDNVTAIHLHDTNVCVAGTCLPGDTAGTKHALNIYGVPRVDDADMTFSVPTATVSGLWDDSDENTLTPAPSGKPSDFLTQLLAGDMFLMVHTQTIPSGAYGGFLEIVPEPSSTALLMTGVLGMFCNRRQRT